MSEYAVCQLDLILGTPDAQLVVSLVHGGGDGMANQKSLLAAPKLVHGLDDPSPHLGSAVLQGRNVEVLAVNKMEDGELRAAALGAQGKSAGLVLLARHWSIAWVCIHVPLISLLDRLTPPVNRAFSRVDRLA